MEHGAGVQADSGADVNAEPAADVNVKSDLPNRVYYVMTPFVTQIATKLNLVSKKYDFDTVFSNHNKTNIFFNKLKDKDDISLRSNVVYNILCKYCNKVHIRQTKRYLKTRILEHKTNYSKSLKQQMTLPKHQLDKSHRFNFDNVKILANEKNEKKE